MCLEMFDTERNSGNCYFCGMKLTGCDTGVNNADPLAIPDEEGRVSACAILI